MPRGISQRHTPHRRRSEIPSRKSNRPAPCPSSPKPSASRTPQRFPAVPHSVPTTRAVLAGIQNVRIAGRQGMGVVGVEMYRTILPEGVLPALIAGRCLLQVFNRFGNILLYDLALHIIFAEGVGGKFVAVLLRLE